MMSQTPTEGALPPTDSPAKRSSVTADQQYAYKYHYSPAEYQRATAPATSGATAYSTTEQQEQIVYPYNFPGSSFENASASSTTHLEDSPMLTGSYTTGESSSTAPPEAFATADNSGLLYRGYRSTAMKAKRRDKVRVMMGDVPPIMPTLFPEAHTVDITGKSFNLTVVVQPRNCRASGFSNTDRRPINPTPIVRLLVTDQHGQIDQESFQNPFFVVHVSLSSVDKTQKYDCVVPPSRTSNTSTAGHSPSTSSSAVGMIMDFSDPTIIAQSSSTSGSNLQIPATEHTPPENIERVLLGPLVCSGSTYRGLDQQRGIYFAFPDLSIRLAGPYRLHFNLMLLGRSDTVIADVYSDPFTVYTAKAFPGMEVTSELADHLNKQGLKLPLRNKVRQKRKKSTDKEHQ